MKPIAHDDDLGVTAPARVHASRRSHTRPIEPRLTHPLHRHRPLRATTPLACLSALLLSACMTAGPDFHPRSPPAPADWTAWSGAGPSLARVGQVPGAPQADWWRAFGDPVLDRLEARVAASSPDLQTAALRFAQARLQRVAMSSQRLPEVHGDGGMSRQRQSEYAASTRLLDTLAGANRDALARTLAQPFTLYQAGFDASWELDLWGRVRRALESADAQVDESAALLEATRAAICAELARDYLELRTTQTQLELTARNVAAQQERIDLVAARRRRGLTDDAQLQRQRTLLDDLRAQQPGLLERQAQSANRIGLLLGLHPGELASELGPAPQPAAPLPDYRLGLPSELAGRRPDVRAAEARLHRAVADIGEAQAQLYPSIRLGARAGLETYEGSRFGDWGNRTWSIGPTLDLPIFDGRRRRTTVQLRELAQQEAAVAFHRTVLQAWKDIDDALTAYAAERAQLQTLQEKLIRSSDLRSLAEARERAGVTDHFDVLDARRAELQARLDRVACEGRAQSRWVAIQQALGY